ncbi:MAG: hypothetical protein IK088_08495, partial [Lachnospiraceae bacterium]|nr:hypothetical protein [Lachnospiraceae bacterium]
MNRLLKKATAVLLPVVLLAMLIPAIAANAAGGPWTITATSRLQGSSTAVAPVQGAGTYEDEANVSLTANPALGYRFIGWYDAEDTSYSTILSAQQRYAFKATENKDLVALYGTSTMAQASLTVHGSKYKVNGGATQTNFSKLNFNVGETMFVNYTDTASEFLYWAYPNGNIATRNKDYSFMFGGNTELFAYSANANSSADSAQVIFRNAYSQILSSRNYKTSETIEFPLVTPNKMGSTFDNWYIGDIDGNPTSVVATQDSITALFATNNAVIVVPGYLAGSGQYTVVVNYTDGTNELQPSVSDTLDIGTSKNFEAPADIDGKVFQYWERDGQIIGYDPVFTVISAQTGTVTLNAVYGDSSVVAQPTISIIQFFPKNNHDGNHYISTTMQYEVPDIYTVSESGFVFSTDESVYNETNVQSDLVLDAAASRKHISGKVSPSVIYTFNGRTNWPLKKLFIKAYVIYRDTNGQVHTLYSDYRAATYKDLATDWNFV